MLTQQDLQAIQKIVETTVDERLTDAINTKMTPLIDQKLKPLKKQLNKIESTIDIMGKLFDSADVKLTKRVKKIEDKLSVLTN